MQTDIKTITDNGDIVDVASYSLSKEEAIVCFYNQFVLNNMNTWDYKNVTEYPAIKRTVSGNYCFEYGGLIYNTIENKKGMN